jgi:hypothetical protein
MPASWRAHSRGMEWWIDGVMDGWGDYGADCLRYLVATKSHVVAQRQLRGL